MPNFLKFNYFNLSVTTILKSFNILIIIALVKKNIIVRSSILNSWNKFLIVLVLICFSACEVPFINNFEEITGEKISEEMVINYKESTSQDAFGDYGSIMIVNVGFDFYNNLPQKLLKRQFKIAETVNFGEFEKTKGNIKLESIISQYEFRGNSVYYSVGLLSDKESILLIRSSW